MDSYSGGVLAAEASEGMSPQRKFAGSLRCKVYRILVSRGQEETVVPQLP